MDFRFSEEQELIAESVRGFARDVLPPRYAHWDRTGEVPREQFLKMGEMGLLALRVPEEYGGQATEAVASLS